MLESMLGCKPRRLSVGDGPDPYWDKVVLMLNMESDFKDLSLKQRNVSVYNNVDRPKVGRFSNNWSAQPLNTSSGLVAAANDDFVFLSGTDFTIEAWIFTYTSRSYKQIVGQWGGYNAYQMSIYGDTLGWQTPSDGTRYGTTISLNVWHHTAVCRSGNTLRLFLDGILVGEYADGFNYNLNPDLGMGIGKVASQDGFAFMEGYIDEVRITKGIARYLANFTPPSGMFPNFGPV